MKMVNGIMRKFLLSAIAVSLMLIVPLTPFILSENNGGDGTYTNDIFLSGAGELTLDAQTGIPNFTISSPADLAYLAQQVNAGDPKYKDKDYVLTKDIDLSMYDDTFNNGRGWIPIGTESNPFSGTFNGGGNKITGLYIRNPVTDMIGLFGYAYRGTVTDLGLVNVNVYGKSNTGGLIGYAEATDAEGCCVTGSVAGGNNVGGMIGCQESGSVSASSFTGSVSGAVYSGGITGNLQGGTIVNSRSSGMVTAAAMDAGGIAGMVAYGTVANCFSSSRVKTTSDEYGGAGGIAGHLYGGKVNNCVFLGPELTGSKETGRIVGGIYDSAIPSEMSDNYAFNGIPGTWTDDPGDRDGETVTANDIATVGFFEDIFDPLIDDNVWTYGAGKIPGLFGYAEGLPIWIRVSGASYSIYTAEDLVWMAEKINSGAAGYNNACDYFLENDIDLFAYGPQNAYFNYGDGWIPIGRTGISDGIRNPFAGVFDGQGHEIAGLNIDIYLDDMGLFGSITGTVKKLGLVNANVKGLDNVGGIAGYSAGTITDCYVTGKISGNDNVGGIAGYSEGDIERCYATCAVSGNDNVGGIAGYLDGGSVTYCAALNPSVIGGSNTGRVIGYDDGGTLSGNIAFDNMIGGPWTDEETDGTDGEAVSIPEIKPADFFKGIFGTEGPWSYDLCKLPGLFGRTVDTPEHLLLHAEVPVITTDPVNTVIVQGNSDKVLTVEAEEPTDGGTLSYQWYRNDVYSYTGAEPVGENEATHTPDTADYGVFYYFVVVTNTNISEIVDGSQTASATSLRARLTIEFRVDAVKPSIIQQPEGGVLRPGGSMDLTVVAGVSDDGDLTYQWYQSIGDDEHFDAIEEGGTGSTYTVHSKTTGRVFYYVEIMNTNDKPYVNGDTVAYEESIIVEVKTVIDAETPSITVQPQAPTGTVYKDVDAGVLSVTASVTDDGDLTYQWYSNTSDSSTGGTPLQRETEDEFTIPTDEMGTFYYYVTVTNTITGEFIGNETAEISSDVVTIIVTVDAGDPDIIKILGGGYANEGSPVTLSVTAVSPDDGDLTYQWYSNTSDSNAGGTLIPGADGETYVATAPAPSVTMYYYVAVTNTNETVNGNTTATKESVTVRITGNVNAKAPLISVHPASGSVDLNDESYLSVTAASPDTSIGGTLTYQWYSNTTNSNNGGSPISGADDDTYEVPSDIPGTYYYYVVVTNWIPDNGDEGIKTATAKSYAATVKVLQHAEKPLITEQPAADDPAVQGDPFSIYVEAESPDNGDLTYQWYECVDDEDTVGTAIPGATDSTYEVPTGDHGTYYYYVKVTNENIHVNGDQTATISSDIVKVVIEERVDAETPEITTQPEDVDVGALGTTEELSVEAEVSDGGTLTYQWYSNSVKSYIGGTLIEDATDDTYDAPTGEQGIMYYYVIITNTNTSVNGTKTATETSDIVTVSVIIDAKKPIISVQPTGNSLTEGQSFSISVTASSPDHGDLTYQWYSNTTESTEHGTAILGATGTAYKIPTNVQSKSYYYVVITNTNNIVNGKNTATEESDIVYVEVIFHAKAPIITGEPQDMTVYHEDVASLTVTAISPDGGILSYQWYECDEYGENEMSIFGATGATYQPPTDVVDDFYYYVIVTNTNISVYGDQTKTEKSRVASVSVNDKTNAETPEIDEHPESGDVDVGGTLKLSVMATDPGDGVLSYQWYSNIINSNSGGSPIPNATDDTYEVPTGDPDTYYYYVVVTNTIEDGEDIGMTTATATSNVAAVRVLLHAELPLITDGPNGGTVVQFDPFLLSVTASSQDDGDLTYQWYKCDDDLGTNGTSISNATSTTYSVPTGVPGTYYYYVEITNTNDEVNGTKTATETSATVSVTVAEIPNILKQPEDVSVNALGTTEDLSVEAEVSDGGDLTYQWYSNLVRSNTGGDPIPGATGETYAAPIGKQGIMYYYVVITNTNTSVNGTQTAIMTSEAAMVAVIINAKAPAISDQPEDCYRDEGETAELTVTATSPDDGVLSYRWQRSTDGTTWNNISGATGETYIATAGAPGTMIHYRVIVTNTNDDVNGTKTATETSAAAFVKGKVNAEAPLISVQPVGGSVNIDGLGPVLSVTASSPDGGTLTYEWYGKGPGEGEFRSLYGPGPSSSYTVPTDVMGTFYYYVVVTNEITVNLGDGGVKTKTADSDEATVIVIVNAAAPSISIQPAGGSYKEGTAAPLSVTASSPDGGRLTYQWYRNTSLSNTGGTLISGATGRTYNVPTNVMGDAYYYVVVTNFNGTVNGKTTETETSAAVTVTTLFDAKAPLITSQPAGGSYPEGAAVVLRVTASSPDGGTLSYQWYSNDTGSNTAGTLISEATGPTYSVPTNVQSELYYYVVITNTNTPVNGTTTAETASNAVQVKVIFNAKPPIIVTQPASVAPDKGVAAAMTVTAAPPTGGNPGDLSYQWYSNTVNNNISGTEIDGATDPTYNVPTDTAGRTFYYVVVTYADGSVNGDQTASVRSNTASATVMANAAEPEIEDQPMSENVHVGDVVTLSVTATSSDGGKLTYQWYSNTTLDNTGGTPIEGAERSTYSPDTSKDGTFYYYVVVTNTIINTGYVRSPTEDIAIDPVAVKVMVKAKAPIINTQPRDGTAVAAEDDDEKEINIALTVTATSPDGGILSYQWYVAAEEGAEGDPIPTAVGAKFESIESSPGTYYYYVIVTNTITDNGDGGTKTAETKSNVITFIVDVRANAQKPVIESIEIESDGPVFLDSLTFLAVTATSPDGGRLTYIWYSSPDGENWTRIPGATSAMYPIPTKTAGMMYYYAEVINTNNNVNGTPRATDDTASKDVTVWIRAGMPEITVEPVKETSVDPEVSVTLSVTVNDPGDGTLSYQWYRNTVNSNTGGEKVGTNSNTYSPDTSKDGTFYYYVVVTNTIEPDTFVLEDWETASVKSVTAMVKVYRNAGTPSINEQPAGETVVQYNSFTLSVEASTPDTDGTLRYQWYSNTVNSNTGGTPVGTNSSTYSPPVDEYGTFYFYVIVTSTIPNNGDGGVKTKTVTSVSVTLVIQQLVNTKEPYINALSGNKVVEEYETYQMKVTASVSDGGTLTYQWYWNTTNSRTDSIMIMNGDEDTYEHRSGTPGVYYYYVEITNTNGSVNGAKTAVTVSNFITVTVAAERIPIDNGDEEGSTEIPITIIAAAAAGGIAAMGGAGYFMMRRKP